MYTVHFWHAKKKTENVMWCGILTRRRKDMLFSVISCCWSIFCFTSKLSFIYLRWWNVYTEFHKANCYVKCRIKMMYMEHGFSAYGFSILYFTIGWKSEEASIIYIIWLFNLKFIINSNWSKILLNSKE